MEYYMAEKRHLEIFWQIDGSRKYHLSEVTQTQKDKYQMYSLISGF